MQHEHGWEPVRNHKRVRRGSLRRLLGDRLRPWWLPRGKPNLSRAPAFLVPCGSYAPGRESRSVPPACSPLGSRKEPARGR